MIRYSADFDIVDSAVWDYLQGRRHRFNQLKLNDGVYHQYDIFPDARAHGRDERLGCIVLRATPAGTMMEFGEPRVQEPKADWKPLRKAEREVAKRHGLDGYVYDDNDPEQQEEYYTLLAKANNDPTIRQAQQDVQDKIKDEREARYNGYAGRMIAITVGLRSWLQLQGIDGKVVIVDDEKEIGDAPKPINFEREGFIGKQGKTISDDDRMRRLAYALWWRNLRRQGDTRKTAAEKIEWPGGTDRSGLAMLDRAKNMLERVEATNKPKLMKRIQYYLEQLKIEKG
jgi:hypothetical protein